MAEIKKYPKIVQSDDRGQIVIPKEIRREIKSDNGTAFYVYAIGEDAILLKKSPKPDLENDDSLKAIKQKSGKLGISGKDVEKMISKQKKSKGPFEVVE